MFAKLRHVGSSYSMEVSTQLLNCPHVDGAFYVKICVLGGIYMLFSLMYLQFRIIIDPAFITRYEMHPFWLFVVCSCIGKMCYQFCPVRYSAPLAYTLGVSVTFWTYFVGVLSLMQLYSYFQRAKCLYPYVMEYMFLVLLATLLFFIYLVISILISWCRRQITKALPLDGE